MKTAIEELTTDTEERYDELLCRVPKSLLYHSLRYRNFLRSILGGSKDRYLLAFEDGDLVAAMPAFVKQGPYGAVVNSLPFYGSNGSIIALEGTEQQTKKALLDAFEDMCREEEAVTSTIVGNPFDRDDGLFEDHGAEVLDERIGQFTSLPDQGDSDSVAGQLMASFHVKTRNMIRKGERSGFECGHDGSELTMRQLYLLHKSNMDAIGGLAKPWPVFQAILLHFNYDRDYHVYTARKNGVIVSALLVFFFNKTAEYFTPATHEEYRSEQPLSLLIFIAMKDAASKGCCWWNWGGTWLTQDGVYRFKSRWGTKDFGYRYFIKEYKSIDLLRSQKRSALLEAYPYFYVLPFTELVDQIGQE